MNNSKILRRALQLATDALDQAQRQPQRPAAFTYVPPSHARALETEATLVEGIRGAGKSFWWAQLASERHRAYVQQAFPETRLPIKVVVAQGFGSGLAISEAPDAEALADLAGKFRPRSIWRAVIARHAGFDGPFHQFVNWSDRVQWVQDHPEAFAAALEAADRKLAEQGQTLLILFDALDRLADDWQHISPLARALLQVVLDTRSTLRIRCKVFLRPDILQDQSIIGFPDFSKLLAGKASLEWRRADLYALLFQCLGNADKGGLEFRELVSRVVNVGWEQRGESWPLPSPLRIEEDEQEKVVEALAGKAMGSSTKRGKPYTWLVNHLQDGLNQVSPRSFFAALKTAADETGDDYELPLDYRGIQRGVQRASQIRVQEITEDYPWVRLVMDPLRGRITVPCEAREFKDIWREEGTLDGLAERLKVEQAAVKLPPQNLGREGTGVLLDLEGLGMVQRLESQRIQMPDVYRIAYGLGRRGGVKPLR